MNKQAQFNLWYFLFALMAVKWLHELWEARQQVEHIPYSEFQQALKNGETDTVAVFSNTIRGNFTQPRAGGPKQYVAERSTFLGVPMAPEMRRDFSEETAQESDCAVREIVTGAFEKATGILEQRRDWLERGAKQVLERETLVEEDLTAFRAPLSTAA